MKVSNQAPEVVKRPVYVTSEIYEIWYSKPISLGRIHNIKGYWYTADNMRFVSSRDAMEYLIRMSEKPQQPQAGISTHGEQVSADMPTTRRQAGPAHPPTTATTPTRPTIVPKAINQNHPKFQEFLEFHNWLARKKTTSTQVDSK